MNTNDVIVFERALIHHVVLINGELAFLPCGRGTGDQCQECDRVDTLPKCIGVVTAIGRNIGTFTVR